MAKALTDDDLRNLLRFIAKMPQSSRWLPDAGRFLPEIRVMAAVQRAAAQRLAARHPRGSAGVGRGGRLGNLGDEIGEYADRRRQRLRHSFIGSKLRNFSAKHEELDQRVRRCCAPSEGVFSVWDAPRSP